MNKHDDSCITQLKKMVEERLGRKPDSPANFNILALDIMDETGETVSVSTLKRMWGYVSYQSKPSTTVLSVLARYVGQSDWATFCLQQMNTSDSDFLTTGTVKADTLKKGDIVELEWLPNRYCKIECLGSSRFRVLESRNSKLFPGNTFKAEFFAKGMPFYVTDLRQDLYEGRIYVAGERHGLKKVTMTRKSGR